MNKTLALLLGAALYLLSAQARAEENADLQRGISLLNNMEDAKALEVFQQILAKPGLSEGDRVQAYLYKGIAHFNLLDKEAARAAFGEALKIYSEVSLPDMISPKIAEFFEEVRRQHRLRNKQQAAQKTTKAPTSRPIARSSSSATPSPPKSKRTGLRAGAFATLGLAVAAAGGGLAMGLLSRSEADKAEDLALSYAEAKDHHDRAKTDALVANILFGTAGAAAVASAVLLYFGYRSEGEPRVSVLPVDGGALMQVEGLSW